MVRPDGDRRRGEWCRRARQRRGHGPAPSPDGLRPQLRVGHRGRGRGAARLVHESRGVVMDHSTLAFPILTVLVLLPAAGALVVALLPSARTDLVRLIGVMFTATVGALSVWLLGAYAAGDGGFQFVSKHLWIGALGVSWHLGVDGISLFLVVLSGILFPIALLGARPHHDE